MMNYKGVILVLVILLGIVGGLYVYVSKATEGVIETPIAVGCTQEAKICPDGSSVGRTGPACAFAECPEVPIVVESATAGLNQKIFNNGIYITPLDVVSDSRCPSDVVCIAAGEITLRALLEKGTTTKSVTLKLQSTVVFEANNVTLTAVAPEKKSTTIVNNADYRFTFLVTQLATPTQGTISGKVTTSPTCPVETNPPEPQCTPKPYATSIRIREKGETEVIKTIQSNNSGTYSTELPVGQYELETLTVNNTTLPRCSVELVQVSAGKNTVQDISCDTGIR